MNSSTETSAEGEGGRGRSWPLTTSVSASGKRIQNDMSDLNLDPPSYCSAGPKGDNLYHWVAALIGPSGTPYEDGIFFLDITFPSEYPFLSNLQRVLYKKRYKELEAGYALCQRLPKVKATIRMLIQIGNVYTKKIFEEFQNEYFQSIESDIEAIEYGEASTIYTVVDIGNKHARKVKMERDGSLGCNCTKFEREGILCCHSLKIIRDILKMKEVPPQYILKRWTKQARAEIVKDIKENDIQVDVKFQQASRYKTLMNAFRALASRAAETEETYDFCIAHLATLGANVEGKLSAHFGVGNEVSNDDDNQSFEVDCEDVNHVVQPKGLKKKVATSKGKMRVKGGFEAALVANSKKKSRANSLASLQSIASPTVAPSPLSVGGDIYVRQHLPHLQPLPPLHHLRPSLAMGGNSIPPPLTYPTHHANNLREMYVMPNSMPQRYSAQPTFQSLLQGSCGYDIAFRYSQESNSPMCYGQAKTEAN